MTNQSKINLEIDSASKNNEINQYTKKIQDYNYKPLNFSTKNNFWRFFSLKRFLGCLSYETVIQNERPLKINGHIFNYHNLFHYEVSHLARIMMGQNKVSGIHGFYSSMFHDCYFDPEYNGALDEARVAIHEWLTRTSIFSTLKAINWMVWLMLIKINPILVIIAHVKSIKQYQGDKLLNWQNNSSLSLYHFLHYFL
ncbi:MAG: hypothetical protein AAGE96_01655 [Cyanobacteria bacterium P01_G01_bin.19]